MIRKNKANNENEKNQNEIKNREENLKKELEQRQVFRKKQEELTQNLVKTYSHIRPTIIQGQRILKIMEILELKSNFLSYLTSDAFESINLDNLSNEHSKLIRRMIDDQSLFFEIKEEIQAQQELLKTYTDEEELNEENNQTGENKKHQQIMEKLNEKKKKLETLSSRKKKETRD